MVFVEVPTIGRKAAAKEAIAVIESVKAASDIYAPVSGTVVEANENVTKNPAMINTDPYGEGWLFVLKTANPDELGSLKDAAGYRQQIS